MTVEATGGLDRSDDLADRHQRLRSRPEVVYDSPMVLTDGDSHAVEMATDLATKLEAARRRG